jgi:hypothetical protein
MCIGLLNEWSHNLKFNNMFGGQRVGGGVSKLLYID